MIGHPKNTNQQQQQQQKQQQHTAVTVRGSYGLVRVRTVAVRVSYRLVWAYTVIARGSYVLARKVKKVTARSAPRRTTNGCWDNAESNE